MLKTWTSAVYAFFEPEPVIDYVGGRHCHVFRCAARGCKFTSRWFLDTGDRSLTGNLSRHAKACWGEDAWKAAKACHDSEDA